MPTICPDDALMVGTLRFAHPTIQTGLASSSWTLMVRRRFSAVSNHEAPLVPFILRDAASRLLRMRSDRRMVGTLRFAHPTIGGYATGSGVRGFMRRSGGRTATYSTAR